MMLHQWFFYSSFLVFSNSLEAFILQSYHDHQVIDSEDRNQLILNRLQGTENFANRRETLHRRLVSKYVNRAIVYLSINSDGNVFFSIADIRFCWIGLLRAENVIRNSVMQLRPFVQTD